MIPIEITLKNFLAYADPGALSFEGVRVAVLTGENGAGKSSVLDGITWALWGKARSPVDELIREGAHDMSVQLVFESHGERYLVLRKRKEGSRSSLDLQILDTSKINAPGKTQFPWKSLAGSNMKETQEIITDVVGLDYETFINASMILQGRIDEFTSKTAGARKQVLADILMLGQWEAYEELAKLNVRVAQGILETLETQIKIASDQVNANKQLDVELSVANQKAKIAGKELESSTRIHATHQKLRETVTAARKLWHGMESSRQDVNRDISRVENDIDALLKQPGSDELNEELDALKENLSEGEVSDERMGKIEGMINTLDKQVAGLESTNIMLDGHIKQAQSTVDVLKSLDEPRCPTCLQSLDPGEQESVMQDILATMTISANDIEMNNGQVDSKISEILKLRSEQTGMQDKIHSHQNLQRQIGQVEVRIESVAENVTRQEKAEALLAELQERHDKIEADYQDASEKHTALMEQLSAETVTDVMLDALRRDKEATDRTVGALQNQLELLGETKKQLDAWRAEEMDLADDVGVLKEVRVAFSKKGVPAMLIEEAVPEIERAANDLLLRLTDGRMHVRFDTQKELKSGDMAEALEIVISDELGARSYENYSGGEKFKINFAIRIALSKLLAHRAGVQLRSLFIDEGFGTQDAAGREQVVAAINEIREDFDCILVITHIEELKEAFPVQIEVIKSDSGSTFRVIR